MKTKAFGGIAIRVLVLLSSLFLLLVLCASAGSLQNQKEKWTKK